jgi:archaellum biogenesis ATPase FlaH
MEKLIIEAAMSGKVHFDELEKYRIRETLSDQGQLIYDLAANYYSHDPEAQFIDREVLKISLDRKYPKHATLFKGLIDALEPTSPPNLLHEIREQQKGAVKLKLAQAFASDKEDQIESLLEQYEQLVAGEVTSDVETDVLIAPDLEEMMASRSAENRYAILPDSLNKALEGGPLPGHHIVVFAPTDMGKTLFLLNAVRGFIAQDLKVLYVGNEDPVSDLIERFLTCLTGKNKHSVREHWQKARDFANKKGWDKVVWAELAPGTLGEIHSLIEVHRPHVLIVDQIRNLDCGEHNFVRTLEKAAQGMRSFAKKYNLVAISVTQAADSATGKAILNRGDIDNSNVGIPGTADLMLGIGGTQDDEINGVRTLSFAKNKISGNKMPVSCFFNTKTMRVE